MFRITQEPGYEPKVRDDLINIWVDLTAQSSIMVDRIVLKVKQRRPIPSFEWNSQMITKKHEFLDFIRPDWFNSGKYEAKLIAYTPEGHSKSEKFIIEVIV